MSKKVALTTTPVTLTQNELSAHTNVVQAQTAAQIAAAQAKPVLDKINAAFAPPKDPQAMPRK